MDVQELKLSRFLEGYDKNFIIPVYQRDYAWKRADCQKLWNDLLTLVNQGDKTHFLGTIVTINTGRDKYSVIDGQQRLTTSTLLLLAINAFLSKISESDRTTEEQKLIVQVQDFLINKYETNNNTKIKLKPNKQDNDSFVKLFNKDYSSSENNIYSNFRFFLDKFEIEKANPYMIFDAFKNLTIVSIVLDSNKDNPQLIFESLNSTGVDLEEADLIRNYILMDLDPQIQEKYYNQYWNQIEKNVGNVTEFFRVYLIYKSANNVRSFEIYTFFKQFIKNTHLNKEEILHELLNTSVLYGSIVGIKEYENTKIKDQLNQLQNLEFTVANPFLLDLFVDLRDQLITTDQAVKVINTLISHTFRKLLVDNSTQGFNKFYMILAREIKKNDYWKDRYYDIFCYLLLNRKSATRFPTDNELYSNLKFKDLYNLKSKNRNFLLQNLENFNHPYKLTYETIESLTVEHILPQNLKIEDISRLGEDYKELHKQYVHTIGNLTLTAKNSELSNNDLETKQQIDFLISRLTLTMNLDQKTEIWGPQQIEQRTRDLTSKMIKIWQYPTTDYQPT
ncbi:MAG: DUF262 domain-containing protein, partial [Patescibacteria group bacterium]